MAAARIAILTHLRQGLQHQCMVDRLIKTVWRPAGIDVVVQQGLRNPPEADLALLHVDLTVTPPDYLALGARYPRCLNLAVTDISKRRISRNLVTAEDDYDGPVIVKTDRNSGGRPEHALWLSGSGRGRRLQDRVRRRLPSSWTGRLPGGSYQVLVERRGTRCVVHQWYFFGEADCVVPVYGDPPFVDFQKTVDRQQPHREVPEEIRQHRRELGFDFGKLDFVLRDGKAVLLDANRTPALDEPELGRTAMLAGGLWTFLQAP
jgi:hypothetical protein